MMKTDQIISILNSAAKMWCGIDNNKVITDLDAAAAWLQQAVDALRPFAAVDTAIIDQTMPDDAIVVGIGGINGYNDALSRGFFKAANLIATGDTSEYHPTPFRRANDAEDEPSDLEALIGRLRALSIAARSVTPGSFEAEFESAATLMGKAYAALQPFSAVGGWLFARALPDDTPFVEVKGDMISGSIVLTRGHFKAANLALRASIPVPAEMQSPRETDAVDAENPHKRPRL